MTKNTNLRTFFPDAYARLENEPMTEALNAINETLKKYSMPEGEIDKHLMRHDAVWMLRSALKKETPASIQEVLGFFDEFECLHGEPLKRLGAMLRETDTYRQRLEKKCKKDIAKAFPQYKDDIPFISFQNIGDELKILQDTELKNQAGYVASVYQLIKADRIAYGALERMLSDFSDWRESHECQNLLKLYGRARMGVLLSKQKPQSMRIKFK